MRTKDEIIDSLEGKTSVECCKLEALIDIRDLLKLISAELYEARVRIMKKLYKD